MGVVSAEAGVIQEQMEEAIAAIMLEQGWGRVEEWEDPEKVGNCASHIASSRH